MRKFLIRWWWTSDWEQEQCRRAIEAFNNAPFPDWMIGRIPPQYPRPYTYDLLR